MKNYIRKIRYLTEYFVFRLLFSLLKLIGLENSSKFMGYVFTKIGPITNHDKLVEANLLFIYGDKLGQNEIEKLKKKIWRNFGNYIGEFPFIEEKFLEKNLNRVEIKGLDIVRKLEEKNIPMIFFSAHLANWEFILFAILNKIGKSAIIYRKINNPYIDQYVRSKRSMLDTKLISKGVSSGREIVRSIKEKRNFLMLIDQKMNEGIKLPFMGKDAMTTSSPAQLAREYGYALIPVRIIRHGGVKFTIEIYEEFFVEKTKDKKADIENATIKINDIISSWIFENPESWFWQHQRWRKLR